MARWCPVTASAPGSIAVHDLPPQDVIEAARRLLTRPGYTARLVAQEQLKKFVHRLSFEAGAKPASVVVKRLLPRPARAAQLATQRWLPAAGLAWACPRLREVVPEWGGRAVWHLYEDVSGSELDGRAPDPERVGLVVELIAELHARFMGHTLLAECRAKGGDLGIDFFASEVALSVDRLRLLVSLGATLSPDDSELTHKLLERMNRLLDEREERARLLEESGDRITLLHGDLWTTNAIVTGRGNHREAKLIDWDHTGVGPVTYDLSTFLFRFGAEHRPWILGRYRAAALRRGWTLPEAGALNQLFETAEYARYACCLVEAATAAGSGERWGFEQMAEIDGWFRAWGSGLAGGGSE